MRIPCFLSRLFMLILFVLAIPLLADEPKAAMKKKTGATSNMIYTCACDATCKCTSASAKPGKCTCGKDLKAGHVLKVEGTDALVCTCGKGCACKLDPKNPAKCGCGHDLKRVSLKGTGIYFCNCGGSCECNTLSSKPGKCKCGMELKKVD